MVVAGRAAGGAWALGSGFLTTTLRLRVSFALSKMSPPPKSRPSRKSSSSCAGFGLDLGDCANGLSSEGAAGLSTRGDRGDAVGSTAGDDGNGKGDDGKSTGVVDVGAEVGGGSRCCGSGDASGVGSCVFLSFSRRAPKSSGSVGSTRPLRSSSSLSSVMQLPMLGLMADTEELRAPRVSRRVPAKRMPRLPSPQSSKSSCSSAGVCGVGVFSFSPPGALVGSSRSLPQSSSTSILRVDFFFPSLLMVPPSSADDGTLVGMGMPACFAEWMARFVDRSSFGVMSTCQSSSPVLDSERTDMREDRVCIAEFLKSRPSLSSKSPSSQLSNLDVLEVLEAMEAMRCAKLRFGAAMLARVECGFAVVSGFSWWKSRGEVAG
ncbi:hypothetical protein HBH64_230290 [Parastagonospora nodorum]|nr:hypothetical protein HBH90_232210 [Parastagonospora nodorum]KAH4485639.1 hypothetical protein HBH87_233900 [Parastagonospora nodorum]KAH4737231.1 hypothetical protein HBH64_230290 [Parastagonospora nodorum]KAH4764444.1 hypothetical protein HBH65_126790 [Parastagonospora nodorum]